MATETKEKVIPNSKDSEMMVLGCMLTNLDSFQKAAEALDENDFYYTEHRQIFYTMQGLYKQDKPADVHLVSEELKREDKLKAVGGISYVMTLAQYAGTSAHIEEYIKIVNDKSLLRKVILTSQEIEKKALDNPDDPAGFLIEKFQDDLKKLEQKYGKKIPIIPPSEHLERQNQFLKKHRGKDIIGLRTSKIPEFNTHLLGLRELILLAAAPNVGKTALTIQLGIDALENEKEACLIYVSLEMSSLTIFNRMTLHYAGMDFKTFVLGGQKIKTVDGEVLFTKEEFEKIARAKEKLNSFGERLQIIDSEICPFIDARTIINHVEAVKSKTKCERAIVIIDYLQVWTTPQNMGENEADKWRIGEMKKIRDGMKNDPIIVISEARKPSDKNEQWGGDLSDVMGSARGTYTPDVVMLLSPLTTKQLETIWGKRSAPNLPEIWMNESQNEKNKEGQKLQNFLAYHGIAICTLQMAKVRDGMQKFNTNLAFNFRKNTFEKIKWNEIDTLPKDKNTAHIDPAKESQKTKVKF
jgi:replicative DNA helicase